MKANVVKYDEVTVKERSPWVVETRVVPRLVPTLKGMMWIR